MNFSSPKYPSFHCLRTSYLRVCVRTCMRACLHSVCMYMVKTIYKIFYFSTGLQLVKAGEQLHNSKHTFLILINDYNILYTVN